VEIGGVEIADVGEHPDSWIVDGEDGASPGVELAGGNGREPRSV
jgi:hypothetical protein